MGIGRIRSGHRFFADCAVSDIAAKDRSAGAKNESAGSGIQRGSRYVLSSLDIDFLEVFPRQSGGFGSCRKVKDSLAIRSGPFQAFVVKYIPATNLDTEMAESGCVVIRKGQGANLIFFTSQALYEMAADEPCGAGD